MPTGIELISADIQAEIQADVQADVHENVTEDTTENATEDTTENTAKTYCHKIYIQDGHGSVTALVENSKITDTYTYDSYGIMLKKTGDTDNDYLYTGEQYNESTGLYYLRARYMSPETGTFTTMDTYAGTLDNPVSLHKYLYANGNPVMYTDPTGNFSLMETSVAQGIQATINTIITPGFSLQKMLTLANLAVTAYDVATTIRMVFCGEATVLDVALCIVKGLVVQSLISCVATAVFGEAAAFMLKLVGIGQDTYGLIEAIKSKDPKEIVIATVRLAVSVFTLKSQCFTGDTLVSTEEGNRRIDEIKPGDKVLSYNTETGENELQEVNNVSVSKTDILVHIITDDGRDIETTMFHPFYVKNEDGTGEWKAASNLKAGDELLSEDGKKVKVSEVKVEKLVEEITVYNLELDEVHTYYVAGGVLVHNYCEDHHIASDKSKKSGYTSEYEAIFESAGMSLQDKENIVSLEEHRGAHTKAYKEFVLKKLKEAVENKTSIADRNAALKLALGELKELLLRYNRLPYSDGKSIIEELSK